ncbi:hypothetical protein LINPERPRIM_LOCUS31811 [Linum perenne]
MAKIGVDRAAPIADEVPAGVFDGEDQAAIGPDVDPNEFIHVDAQVEGWTIRSRLSSLLTKIYRKLERGRISVCWLESFGMNQGNSGWWKTRSFRTDEDQSMKKTRAERRINMYEIRSHHPSVIKRKWVLKNQPWFFQRLIIHFTDNMIPSEDLYHSLQFMAIWVKIIGLPFSSLTIAVGRKLLAKLGEIVKIGYFNAGTPEGSYIKGRVRMDLLDSFLGTTPVIGTNGVHFLAYFQYIGVPCICYLCGFLGHVMTDCDQTDLIFYEHVRSSWICGKADPNEKDSQRPQFQLLPIAQSQNPRGRGGLPPSVAADLSSNLQ